MRSSKSLILAGCLTVLTVALVGLGCSDDSPPTTVVPPEEDHGIETMVEGVSDQVNAHLDSAVIVIGSGLEVATFIDVGGGEIGDVFMGSINPDSTQDDNDWIISWATDLQSGLGTQYILDSLTYVVNGELSVNARGADAMHVKHRFTFESTDTTMTCTNLANRSYLHVTGIDGATATVNGVFSTTINDKHVSDDSTVWNDWTIETSVTNLAVTKTGSVWTNGCPATGTALVNVEHRYARDLDVPITTDWEMIVTFIDGDVDVDVTTGHLSTSYEACICTP